MNLSTKQKQTHKHREQTCGCRGLAGVEEEGRSGSLALADANYYIIILLYYINDKVLLYSTGNYSQYPVINHNGKEYEKECVYICVTESLCCTAESNTTL